jgi:predicted MPP superfamily phosphohydrolase
MNHILQLVRLSKNYHPVKNNKKLNNLSAYNILSLNVKYKGKKNGLDDKFRDIVNYPTDISSFDDTTKAFEDQALTNLLTADKILENHYKELVTIENTEYPKKMFFQKITIKDTDNVYLIGDIHSSLESFRNILVDLAWKKKIFKENENFLKLKKGNYIIFLGDLVDRGPYSIEVLLIALTLKKHNLDQVHIINGNHEDETVYERYGFKTEMEKEIEESDFNKIDNIKYILDRLPTVIFLKFESDPKWFQLCHGGIDENFINETHIRDFLKKRIKNLFYSDIDYNSNGFKWSDFDMEQTGFEEDARGIGVGIKVGIELTNNYLKNNNLYTIISGHQDNINFGFLPKTKTREVNHNECFRNLTGYNLYCPDTENQIEIHDPTDYGAIITSTAVGPKEKIYKHTYLILQKQIKKIFTLDRTKFHSVKVNGKLDQQKDYKFFEANDSGLINLEKNLQKYEGDYYQITTI